MNQIFLFAHDHIKLLLIGWIILFGFTILEESHDNLQKELEELVNIDIEDAFLPKNDSTSWVFKYFFGGKEYHLIMIFLLKNI